MRKKIIYILSLFFFVTSCDTGKEIKRALTGEKRVSNDEFLIQKKDPLVMPPDYQNLPNPEEREDVKEEISTFEKILGDDSTDNDSSTSSSAEESILKKIRSR